MRLDTEAVAKVAKGIGEQADEIVHSPRVDGSIYGGNNMEADSQVSLRNIAPTYADVLPAFGHLAQSVSPHIEASLNHLSKATKVLGNRMSRFVTDVKAVDEMGDEHAAATLRGTRRHP